MGVFYANLNCLQSCELIGEEDEIAASEDPTAEDPVYIVTSEGVRAVRRSNTSVGDVRESPLAGSGSGGSGTTSSGSGGANSSGLSVGSRKESIASAVSGTTATLSTPTSSIDTPSSSMTTDTTLSTHAAPAVTATKGFVDPFLEHPGEEAEEPKTAPLFDRPVVAVHVFTPLVGSMLLSQNSLVADPTRAAIVAILAKLRKAQNAILDEWTAERSEGIRQVYIAQAGAHAHDLQPFSTSARRMVQKELLEGLVLGMGRLESDSPEVAPAMARKSSDELAGDRSDSLLRSMSRSSNLSTAPSRSSASSEEAMLLKQQLAQEATLGRAISMNFIASVSDFFTTTDITRFGFVAELSKCVNDEPGVKAEAALALSGLAKLVPEEHVEPLVSDRTIVCEP